MNKVEAVSFATRSPFITVLCSVKIFWLRKKEILHQFKRFPSPLHFSFQRFFGAFAFMMLWAFWLSSFSIHEANGGSIYLHNGFPHQTLAFMNFSSFSRSRGIINIIWRSVQQTANREIWWKSFLIMKNLFFVLHFIIRQTECKLWKTWISALTMSRQYE